jgi:hypothetical protein
MLKKSGQVSEFFDVEWVFVEKRKVALWEFWLFILWIENKLNKEVVNKLIELCKKENCLFIQIETIDYSNNFNLNIKNFKKWYLNLS